MNFNKWKNGKNVTPAIPVVLGHGTMKGIAHRSFADWRLSTPLQLMEFSERYGSSNAVDAFSMLLQASFMCLRCLLLLYFLLQKGFMKRLNNQSQLNEPFPLNHAALPTATTERFEIVVRSRLIASKRCSGSSCPIPISWLHNNEFVTGLYTCTMFYYYYFYFFHFSRWKTQSDIS